LSHIHSSYFRLPSRISSPRRTPDSFCFTFPPLHAASPNFAQITFGNILYSSQILTIAFHHHSLTHHTSHIS
jgi:hypothetical protein